MRRSSLGNASVAQRTYLGTNLQIRVAKHIESTSIVNYINTSRYSAIFGVLHGIHRANRNFLGTFLNNHIQKVAMLILIVLQGDIL